MQSALISELFVGERIHESLAVRFFASLSASKAETRGSKECRKVIRVFVRTSLVATGAGGRRLSLILCFL